MRAHRSPTDRRWRTATLFLVAALLTSFVAGCLLPPGEGDGLGSVESPAKDETEPTQLGGACVGGGPVYAKLVLSNEDFLIGRSTYEIGANGTVTTDGVRQWLTNSSGDTIDEALIAVFNNAATSITTYDAKNQTRFMPSYAGQCAEMEVLDKLAADSRNRSDQKRKLKSCTEIHKKDKPAVNECIRQRIHDAVLAGRLSAWRLKEKCKGTTATELDRCRDTIMNPCPFCAQVFRELGIHPKSSNYENNDKQRGVFARNSITKKLEGEPWKGEHTFQGKNLAAGGFEGLKSTSSPFVE